MTTYVILLRAVMPTGKNKVPMAKLREVLTEASFKNVRTYIQSGNALVDSPLSESGVAKRVHDLILKHIGADLGVMVRTGTELAAVLKKNPFPKGAPARVGVTFFTKPLPKDFMQGVSTTGKEEVLVSGRELYVDYGDGMGSSKLKLPKIAKEGTVRNMNTVAKLVELSKSK